MLTLIPTETVTMEQPSHNPNVHLLNNPQVDSRQQPGTLRVFWTLSIHKAPLSVDFDHQASSAAPVYATTIVNVGVTGDYTEDGVPKDDSVGFSNKSIRAGFIRKVRVVGLESLTFASRRSSRWSQSAC